MLKVFRGFVFFHRFQCLSGFEQRKKTKPRENFQLRPELIVYTKTSSVMMVWTMATILRDEIVNIVFRTVECGFLSG